MIQLTINNFDSSPRYGLTQDSRAIRRHTAETACGNRFSHSAGCLISEFHRSVFTRAAVFGVVGCAADRQSKRRGQETGGSESEA